MTEEQERWLGQAGELARSKCYDDARELALRVLREDGSNARALWLVASVTNSLPERRNVLRALVRVQPQNHHARQMLDSIEQEFKLAASTRPAAAAAVPALKPAVQPMMLYAIVIVALVVIAAAFIVTVL